MLTSYRTWDGVVSFCKPRHESVPCEPGSKSCNHKGARERWHACPAAAEHICGAADARVGVDLILQVPLHIGAEAYYIRPELGVQMHRVSGAYGTGINGGPKRGFAKPQVVLNQSARLDLTRGGRCMISHQPTTNQTCGGGEAAATSKLGWALRASTTAWLHHSICIDLIDLEPTAADQQERRVRWRATLREEAERRSRFAFAPSLHGGRARLSGKRAGWAAVADQRIGGAAGGGGRGAATGVAAPAGGRRGRGWHRARYGRQPLDLRQIPGG